MNQIDILLDMITGSLKDHSAEKERDANPSSSGIDLSDLHHLHKFNWQQIHSLYTTLMSNVFCTKIFYGRLANKKNENNNEGTAVCVPNKTTVKTLKNICKMFSLNNTSKRKTFSNNCNKLENDFVKDLLGFDPNAPKNSQNIQCENLQFSNADMNYKENLFKAEKTDTQNSGHGLELFFQSVINCTQEFNEEEILELQIQILKSVKNIKGKRDLKMNFRRYCVALMNLNDHNIKKTNVK